MNAASTQDEPAGIAREGALIPVSDGKAEFTLGATSFTTLISVSYQRSAGQPDFLTAYDGRRKPASGLIGSVMFR